MFVDRVINSDLIESAKVRNIQWTKRPVVPLDLLYFSLNSVLGNNNQQRWMLCQKEKNIVAFQNYNFMLIKLRIFLYFV